MHDDVKAYRTYEEQVDLLAGRGMAIGDRGKAIATLQRVNYYRLSLDPPMSLRRVASA